MATRFFIGENSFDVEEPRTQVDSTLSDVIKDQRRNGPLYDPPGYAFFTPVGGGGRQAAFRVDDISVYGPVGDDPI
jgi:hypothetical protein